MDKKILLTTGQMAELHGINKRTLMYYDDIGLFSPAIKDEKGFRYYTYEQCLTLQSILAWRELDMPIDKIRDYNQNPSAEAFFDLVSKKEKEIRQKIKRLERIRSLLTGKAADIQNVLSSQLNTINIEECDEEYLLTTPLLDDISYINIFSSVADAMKSLNDKAVYYQPSGTIISVDKIINRDCTNYDRYYFKLPKKRKHPNLYIKPMGTYLQMFWKGDWGTLPAAYNNILIYAKENHLEFADYSYEESIIDHTISNDTSDYITKIMVQLKV